MKKSKFQTAVETLEQLLNSPSRIAKKAAKQCLETWKKENRKRLTKEMQNSVMQVERINQTQLELMKKRNEKKIQKASNGVTMIEFIQSGANQVELTPNQVRNVLSQNVCLISYILKADSKTTGEKKGTYTLRFATRKRLLYTKLEATGTAVDNGTIKYYSLADNSWRSCSNENFMGVVEFPMEITKLFERSTPEMRKHYAEVAQQAILKRRAIIDSKDLQVDIA